MGSKCFLSAAQTPAEEMGAVGEKTDILGMARGPAIKFCPAYMLTVMLYYSLALSYGLRLKYDVTSCM